MTLSYHKFIKNHYLSLLFGAFILIISLIPFQSVPGRSLFNFPHMDKIVHFVLYGMFSFVILFESLWKQTFTKKTYFYAVLVCLIFGGIIEFLQILEPDRSGEWYDLLANFLGSVAAILPFVLLKDFLLAIFGHKNMKI